MQKALVTEQMLEVASLLLIDKAIFISLIHQVYYQRLTNTGKSISSTVFSTNKSLKISKSLKVESIGYDSEGLGRCSAKV